MLVKRKKGEDLILEDFDFLLELLLRKKYVEKLEKIVDKVRKTHTKDSNCSICTEIQELDEFYTHTRKLYEAEDEA